MQYPCRRADKNSNTTSVTSPGVGEEKMRPVVRVSALWSMKCIDIALVRWQKGHPACKKYTFHLFSRRFFPKLVNEEDPQETGWLGFKWKNGHWMEIVFNGTPKIDLSRGISQPLYNTCFLGPTWTYPYISISIGSAVFCRAHERDRQTDVQTTLLCYSNRPLYAAEINNDNSRTMGCSTADSAVSHCIVPLVENLSPSVIQPFIKICWPLVRSALQRSRPNKAGLKCLSVCPTSVHTWVRPQKISSISMKFGM